MNNSHLDKTDKDRTVGDDVFDTALLFKSIHPHYPELTGQVAIVTGASKGVGKGIAIRLGREGMKLVLNARTTETVRMIATELESLGVETLPIPGDIGRAEDTKKLFDETMNAFGTVDLLVNNAADLRRVNFFDVSEAMMEEELNTNIKGPFICSYKAAQLMRKNGHGNIIHISTVGGLRAHNPGLPYDATKGALDSMTQVMGIELAQFGIRVNGIAPGAIHTENRLPLDHPRVIEYAKRIPMNRLGLPLEIGAVVAFLASEDASYIIGQTIYVDGGITAQLSPPQYPI
jgi:NAD(P)-dependent dehydrogenase (short-subunit alcohol dehydrogenase family)